MKRSPPHPALRSASTPALQTTSATAVVAAGLVFCVYLASLAPGITWAHQGADGGELLAAAVSNGVPHPPGYPLYTISLRAWLALIGMLAPMTEVAWRGNLLSALFGAASVFLTVHTAWSVLEAGPQRRLWAAAAGVLWGLAPLLWSQSILTEVYALHALLITLLGWATLTQSERRPWLPSIPIALGAAHHLTLFLLLPAVFYWGWSRERSARALATMGGWMGLGVLAGGLFYLRIPLVARHAPPVNWGYADSWEGLWWLMSGAAYRGYLFAAPAGLTARRVVDWAYTLASQYTLVGLGLALWGLAIWDMRSPRLRTFSLIWLAPISIYSLIYYTRDSLIYLLPVAWLLALWLGVAGQDLTQRLRQRTPHAPLIAASLTGAALIGLLLWQWPTVSLRQDDAARAYVRGAAAVLETNAILVSRSDAETFALWYGTWGSGELAHVAPGLIPVNDWLYQFDWYGRLQADLYPGVPGVAESAESLVRENQGVRPAFFAEELPMTDGGALMPAPPLWRYLPEPP